MLGFVNSVCILTLVLTVPAICLTSERSRVSIIAVGCKIHNKSRLDEGNLKHAHTKLMLNCITYAFLHELIKNRRTWALQPDFKTSLQEAVTFTKQDRKVHFSPGDARRLSHDTQGSQCFSTNSMKSTKVLTLLLWLNASPSQGYMHLS